MGPAEEFDAFCTAQHARIVAAVYLVCGDVGVAEELAQAALEQAWRRWDRVSRMDAPGGWVQQVAFNMCRSGIRRRAAERRAHVRHGVDGPDLPVDSATVVAVRTMLLDLPVRQREAIVHRFYLRRSTAETAQSMGLSEGAVKQLVHRATTRLRTQLLPEPATEGDDAR